MTEAIQYIQPEQLNEFESGLTKNTLPIDNYMEGVWSPYYDCKKLPSCLGNVIGGFIEHWNEKKSYIYDMCTLYNYNYCDEEWRHFSHTGCVVIFNCSDIDLTLIKEGKEDKKCDLPPGGLVVFESNLRFKFTTEKMDTRLKHLAVFSFSKK